MRTIIAGGRDYRFSIADITYLDELRRTLPITEVVSGHYRGADEDAERWAELRNIPITPFPADWTRLRRSAGPIRNTRMVEYAEALVWFPGGDGTADVRSKAVARGLVVCSRWEG